MELLHENCAWSYKRSCIRTFFVFSSTFISSFSLLLNLWHWRNTINCNVYYISRFIVINNSSKEKDNEFATFTSLVFIYTIDFQVLSCHVNNTVGIYVKSTDPSFMFFPYGIVPF